MTFPFKKILIIGNSGSGKTFLAKKLSSYFQIPVIHLDQLFWSDSTCRTQRPKQLIHDKINEHSQQPEWIIEGIFGEFLETPFSQSDLLIFLDLNWQACHQGLIQRGEETASQKDFAELLEWAKEYWRRDSSTSYKKHSNLFEKFQGGKFKFNSRNEIEEWMKDQIKSGPSFLSSFSV